MQNISGYRLQSFVAGLNLKRESLVAWLNAKKSDASSSRSLRQIQRRAIRLIEALRERNALAESGDKSGKARRTGYDLHLEILKLIRPLRHTRWELVASPEMSDGLDNLRGWYLEQHKGANDLSYVLGLVARLSEYGLLDSVRQCHCGIWFLAYNRRNIHHAPACKREFEDAQRKTPEGKQARNEYMRHYRPTRKRIKSRKSRRVAWR